MFLAQCDCGVGLRCNDRRLTTELMHPKAYGSYKRLA